MLLDIITPISFLQTSTAVFWAIFGCMKALHKTIRKIYTLLFVRIATVLTIVGGITIFCVSSVTNNSGYVLFLEVGYKVDRIKLENEIIKLKNGLDNTYKDIGRNVCNKEQIDGLMNQAAEITTQISIKQNERFRLSEEFKEKVKFENALNDLFSSKITKRREAIRSLAMMGKPEGLPYLRLCSIDTNQIIRDEAIAYIDLLNQQPASAAQNTYVIEGDTSSVVPGQATVNPAVPSLPTETQNNETINNQLNKNEGGNF